MGRLVRVAKAVAKDPSVPRWVRWLVLVGILPIPGPVDEIALFIGVGVICIAYRHRVVHHWRMDLVPALVPLDTWGGWC